MMKTFGEIPNGQHNSLAVSAERKNSVHPELKNDQFGKSVGCIHNDTPMKDSDKDSIPEKRYWFPIRATYRRAKKVYDRLVELNNGHLEPYLPMRRSIEYSDEKSDRPTQAIKKEPLDKGLLFLKCAQEDFRSLMQNRTLIPGMTPYYNHFATDEFGRNEYLTVPDRQMKSFMIIVESNNQNIIVNQTEIPQIIEGDHVVVTGGAFEGVEGMVMKLKHQRRVVVELKGVGRYATAYVPGALLKQLKAEN